MARRKTRTLTEVELEFMQVIWTGGEVTSDDVQEALRRQGRELTGGSVRKMLSILVEKGYLKRRREGLSFRYKPTVGERQARRKMVGDLLKRAFHGKAAPMVAAMIEGRTVRDEDLREIKRLIAEREKEGL